jgi:hypothetical protein
MKRAPEGEKIVEGLLRDGFVGLDDSVVATYAAGFGTKIHRINARSVLWRAKDYLPLFYNKAYDFSAYIPEIAAQRQEIDRIGRKAIPEGLIDCPRSMDYWPVRVLTQYINHRLVEKNGATPSGVQELDSADRFKVSGEMVVSAFRDACNVGDQA